MSNSYLQKIAGAKATNKGNIIREGRYSFAVKTLKLLNGFNGTSFVAEFVVLTAEGVNPQVTPNQVGTVASAVYNLDKHASAAGNVKALMLALLGLEEGKVTEDYLMQYLAAVTADGQPLTGKLVNAETFVTTIRSGANAGKPFTGVNWRHVPESAEAITARRPSILSAGVPAPAPAATPQPAAPPPTGIPGLNLMPGRPF